MVRRRGVKLCLRRKIDALVLESRIEESEKTQEESKRKTTLQRFIWNKCCPAER